MMHLAYSVSFLLAVFFWGLYVWKKGRKLLLIPALACTVLFALAIVWNNNNVQRQYDAMVEAKSAEADAAEANLVVDYQQRRENRPEDSKEQAAYQKSLLAAYDWNRAEPDVLRSGNLALAPDIFRNVALWLITNGLDFDVLYYQQDFEGMVAADPAAYIGNFSYIIFKLDTAVEICKDPGLIACFPQVEGYTVLQETGVIGDDGPRILFLNYVPETVVQSLRQYEIGEGIPEVGVYFGTYTMDGTQYHVFANYIIGE